MKIFICFQKMCFIVCLSFLSTKMLAQCSETIGNRSDFVLDLYDDNRPPGAGTTYGELYIERASTADPYGPSAVYKWVSVYAYNNVTQADYSRERSDAGNSYNAVAYSFNQDDYHEIYYSWEVTYADNSFQVRDCYFEGNAFRLQPASITNNVKGIFKYSPRHKSILLNAVYTADQYKNQTAAQTMRNILVNQSEKPMLYTK